LRASATSTDPDVVKELKTIVPERPETVVKRPNCLAILILLKFRFYACCALDQAATFARRQRGVSAVDAAGRAIHRADPESTEIQPVRGEHVQQRRRRLKKRQRLVVAAGAEPIHQHQRQIDGGGQTFVAEIEPVEYDDHTGQLVRIDRLDLAEQLIAGLQRRDPHRGETLCEILPQRGDQIGQRFHLNSPPVFPG